MKENQKAKVIITVGEEMDFKNLKSSALYYLGKGGFVVKYPFIIILETAKRIQVVRLLQTEVCCKPETSIIAINDED